MPLSQVILHLVQCVGILAMAATSRQSLAYQELKRNVAEAALTSTPTEVARRFCVGVGFVRYNLQKFIDPLFHVSGLGGARNTLFTADEQLVVDILLYREVLLNPVQSGPEYAATLRAVWGLDLDPRWITRRFEAWGYSFKKALQTHRQVFRRQHSAVRPLRCGALLHPAGTPNLCRRGALQKPE